MSLRCSTVREVLWERAASAGPVPLSPALAEHLSGCAACRAEGAAIRELLEIAREMPDPEPPEGFGERLRDALVRALDREGSGRLEPLRSGARRWGALVAGLAIGFALGALTTPRAQPDEATRAAARASLVADVRAELGNDARLESYVREIEELLVAYHAADQGDAVETFRASLPTGLVAGPGAPGEADRRRLERQRALREQLRLVVLGMLIDEVEAERGGFEHLERRIATIAGRQLLYFLP